MLWISAGCASPTVRDGVPLNVSDPAAQVGSRVVVRGVVSGAKKGVDTIVADGGFRAWLDSHIVGAEEADVPVLVSGVLHVAEGVDRQGTVGSGNGGQSPYRPHDVYVLREIRVLHREWARE